MIQIELPCELYGKSSADLARGFHVICCSSQLKKWEGDISKIFDFQWLSDASYAHHTYPQVWYFLPLTPNLGLLALFEDAGSDPRPHVMRRVVALCERAKSHDLLTALKAGNVPRYTIDQGRAVWALEIQRAKPDTVFPWSQCYLQLGDESCYRLKINGYNQNQYITSAPKKLDLKPYITHAAFFLLGAIMLACGMSIFDDDQQESRQGAFSESSSRTSLQQQYNSLIHDAEELLSAHKQQEEKQARLSERLHAFYQYSGHHLSLAQREQLEQFITLFETLSADRCRGN